MKPLVVGLQGHEKDNVRRRKCLHKSARGCAPRCVQHALNEVKTLFTDEVLIY
jgi:hypothetical protein